MSGIWLKPKSLINELLEQSGFKSGVCLKYADMKDFLDEESQIILEKNLNSMIRIRPEEYESIYYDILKGVGYLPKEERVPDAYNINLYHKYKNNPKKLKLHTAIYQIYHSVLKQELDLTSKDSNKKKIDILPFILKAFKQHGKSGVEMMEEILSNAITYQQINPWSSVRRIDWRDTIDLKDLFDSESLSTQYGNFIDQRYINYLSNNLDKLGLIHWQKFEALTCEYFDKRGYDVEISAGRNDDGIDARVWKKGETANSPLLVVQCKRQKEKIDKTVIKALWADADNERAESGLIVTTSEVSIGAKQTCEARGYSIKYAEGTNLKNWLTNMRTPLYDPDLFR